MDEQEIEAAVRRVIEQDRVEREGHRPEDNVDELIEEELARPWGRMNPTNVFGVLQEAKATNPKAWVSPEVSLRMFAAVESVARQAFNEATRG